MNRTLAKFIARRLEWAAHHPEQAQASTLRKLSRRIDLSGVSRTEQMRALPAADYGSIRGEVEKLVNSGISSHGAFGKSPIVGIACTSGTTQEPKRIPITRDYVRAYQRFTLGVNSSYFANQPNPGKGKLLLLTARPQVGETPSGLPEGFISGFMAAQIPFFFRRKVLPSTETLFLPDWEAKFEAILMECRKENVLGIAGVPALIQTFIERALEVYGIDHLRQIWPRFQVLLTSGVAMSESERGRFDRICGFSESDPFVHWDMYASTEAQIGHSFRKDWPGMIFNPFENFYQFRECGEGRFLQLHELRRGAWYNVFVTTPGGLVNYALGDRIEIVSERPLLFRVVGREKEEISIATEKINLKQIQSAISKAGRELGLSVEDFAIWPERGRPSRLVCGVAGLESRDQERLSGVIDTVLKDENPSYREMRMNSLIYDQPRVERIPASLFRDYRTRNSDRGQFKPKRLFPSVEAFRAEFDIDS